MGYTNLGTVEFLVDGDDFYFLEMNTRLQVEHPVTEMITGLDLVQIGIEVAEGKPLSFTQDEVRFSGHAVEARVTCEDPYAGFLPATGTVLQWQTGTGARFDTTLETGAVVTPYYDSMVGKVIAWGEDRESALRYLDSALRTTVLLGVEHNIDFLRRLLSLPEIHAGAQHTQLVESLCWERPKADREALLAAAISRQAHLSGGRTAAGALPLVIEFEEYPAVTVNSNHYSIEGQEHKLFVSGHALEVDGHRFSVVVAFRDEEWWVHTPTGTHRFVAVPRHPVPRTAGGNGSLTAPMPGSVVEVLVKVGQQVKRGEALLKLEAMKMEQVIAAPEDGLVEAIHYRSGDQVEAGARLVTLG